MKKSIKTSEISNANTLGHMQGYPNDIQIKTSDKTSGKITRKEAIKLKCLDCVNYAHPVTQIRGCQNTKCSLWTWRPYKTKNEKVLKRKVGNENYLTDLERARKIKREKR